MWFFQSLVLLPLLWGSILADTECPNIVDSLNSEIDRRENKNQLRLVQYNVEWLFIDYYSGSNCPGDGCTWKNASEAETHMEYVSDVVNKLKPDIIHFCEIEGCDELNMLSSLLDNNTAYSPYLIKGTDTSTGQNVGMLSKIDPVRNLYRTELKYSYPINGSNCGYTGSVSSTGVSKHMITEFQINGINIAFITAHLIAIPTDPARCAQREAQASILQTIIMSYVLDNYEVIMMGDFNDYDLEVADMNGDKPTSRVLDILKGLDGPYPREYELFSVAEKVEQKERYSDWWDSDSNCDTASVADYSMIDHILVTSLLQKLISNVFIYHGYDEYCGKYNSDHYPVIVDFEFLTIK
jgi:exonuclease III